MKLELSKQSGITLIVFIIIIFILFFLIGGIVYFYSNQKLKTISKNITEDTTKEQVLIDDNYQEQLDIIKDNKTKEVKVGDYVNYKPMPLQEEYQLEEKKTGNAGNDIYKIYTEDLGWRVLNINNDGTVNLISARPTKEKSIEFGSSTGYNNGVYILNEMCGTLYCNSNIQAKSRSLNINDIQNLFISDIYIDNEYKQTKTYTKKSAWALLYPNQWINDVNDTSKISESQNRTIIDRNESTTNTNEFTATGTYWRKDITQIKDNFKKVETSANDSDDNIYYQLIFGNGDTKYWLASRYVDTRFYEYETEEEAKFGLRKVYGTFIERNFNDRFRWWRT